MHKGIVMEMTEADLVVLTPDGQFKKVPRMGRVCRVGEEILFSAPPFRLKRPLLSAMLALTAAVVFCIVLFNGLGGNLQGVKPIVAYVTLDINPSVELGIDKDNMVQEARGLNDDGNQLLLDLKLIGQPLSAATEVLMIRVEEKGYFSKEEGDVIISSTKVYEEAKLDETSLGQIVKETVSKHIVEHHPVAVSAIQVTAIVTPPAIRSEALTKGVSTGKYAIYLSAKDNGNDIDLDELKNDSVHKIAKEAGGLNHLIDPDDLPKKETLSKLLEAEKKGELDEKVKKRMAEKEKSDDKKNSSKPTVASPSKVDKDDKKDKDDKDDKKDNNSRKNDKNDKDDDKDDDKNRNNGSRPGNGTTGNSTQKPPANTGRIDPAAGNGGNSGVSKPKPDDKKEEDKRKEEEDKRQEEMRKEQERQKEEQKKKEDQKKEEDKRKEEEKKRQGAPGAKNEGDSAGSRQERQPISTSDR